MEALSRPREERCVRARSATAVTGPVGWDGTLSLASAPPGADLPRGERFGLRCVACGLALRYSHLPIIVILRGCLKRYER
jgi:hypothetical protein